MERVGAQSHVTFGGRLEKNAKGFPASAMAKTHSGDFRSDRSHPRVGARDRARDAGSATASGHACKRVGRRDVVVHAPSVGRSSPATMAALLRRPPGSVLGLHAFRRGERSRRRARHYFNYRGAHDPIASR